MTDTNSDATWNRKDTKNHQLRVLRGGEEGGKHRGHVGAPSLQPRLFGLNGDITFATLGALWTSGELARAFPDHVKKKKSAGDDISRLKRLNEMIGQVPLRAFAEDDAAQAMRELPATYSRATRRQYAQIISKLLSLAVYPCKLIKHSPLPRGWMPSGTTTPAKGFLFPEEEARLLGNTNIPLERRMLYGFLAREGCRLSEALNLEWTNIHLA